MTRSLASSALLCFGVALTLGCSSAPDVVAAQSKDQYYNTPLVADCKEGHYKGGFFTLTDQDASTGLQVSGSIGFDLVLAPQGEFLELKQNSPLTGTSDVPAGGTIHADLFAAEPCRAGHVHTEFQNGIFQLGTVIIHFTGHSDGQYDPELRLFSGTWGALLEPPFNNTLRGSWGAVWGP